MIWHKHRHENRLIGQFIQMLRETAHQADA